MHEITRSISAPQLRQVTAERSVGYAAMWRPFRFSDFAQNQSQPCYSTQDDMLKVW